MDQRMLTELVIYNKDNGEFTWNKRPLSHFKMTRDFRIWNTKHSLKCINNPDKQGYLYLNLNGKRYPLHRLAWLHENNEYKNIEIDHINGIKNDNRISNLRKSSRTENNRHQSIKKSNTSGFKGVYFSKQKGKWTSQIRTSEKRINLGFFFNKEDAAVSYDKASLLYHGDYAKTNKSMGLLK